MDANKEQLEHLEMTIDSIHEILLGIQNLMAHGQMSVAQGQLGALNEHWRETKSSVMSIANQIGAERER